MNAQKKTAGGSEAPSAVTKVDSGSIVPEIPDTDKREATLIAQFAIAGHAVHKLADGGYIVARWTFTRHVPDFAALVGVARQMGVRE